MFALHQALQRNCVHHAARRFASTAGASSKHWIPKMYLTYPEWRAMLSDPSTYPLILIMGFAAFWAAGMSAHALGTYKNLHILPSQKHQVIPNTDSTRKEPLAEKWSREPIAMHAKKFKSIRYEGLGVDHEKWLKQKEKEQLVGNESA